MTRVNTFSASGGILCRDNSGKGPCAKRPLNFLKAPSRNYGPFYKVSHCCLGTYQQNSLKKAILSVSQNYPCLCSLLVITIANTLEPEQVLPFQLVFSMLCNVVNSMLRTQRQYLTFSRRNCDFRVIFM